MVYGSVSQTVVHSSFRRKSSAKIVSDTKQMKNIPIHVFVKSAFLGWPSTETRWISSCHGFLSFSHFIKYFKFVYRKNVGMVTLATSIMFILLTCMQFWIRGILWWWSARAPTAYEVVHNCRKFEKHWSRLIMGIFFSNCPLPLSLSIVIRVCFI
jgi:hypothetical protein